MLVVFCKMLGLFGYFLYGFLLMDKEDFDILYVVKNKSLLLIGVGEGFNVVCLDSLVMLD